MSGGTFKYSTEFIARLEVMASTGMVLWDIDCELKLPLGTAGRLIRRANRPAPDKPAEQNAERS